MTKATGDAWLGYALAYGGFAQLLAGMWEFRNKNVFGATAFASFAKVRAISRSSWFDDSPSSRASHRRERAASGRAFARSSSATAR